MAEPTPDDKISLETLVGTPNEVLQQAVRHFNAGEYAAAATICHQVAIDDPQKAEAVYILANIAIQTQEYEKSLGLFVRAVTIDPINAKYSKSFAEALERTGRNAQAVQAWSQYVTLVGDSADGLARLAGALLAENRITEAVETLQRARDVAPEDADIRYKLAAALHRNGQSRDAIVEFEQAMRRRGGNDDWAACHNGLGAAHRACGQLAQAAAHAARAVAIEPNFAMAHNTLGLSLLDAGDTEGAVAALQRAGALRPDDPDILNNLGVALTRSQDYEAAGRSLRRVLELRPDSAEGHLNLANLRRQQNALETAVEHYRTAVSLQPDDFRIYANLALAQLNADRPFDAIASYEAALALNPGNPDLLKGLGIAQLVTGNFADGWRNYEYRQESQDYRKREFAGEAWDGASLQGASLLVYSEQGFGDTVQFCRYLPEIAAKAEAGRIVFECQRPLCGLMESLAGEYEIVARGDPLPATDRHVGLLSLPWLFQTAAESIPGATPYLHAPANALDLKSRIRTQTPRIGLVWAGNPLRQDDAMRSCSLSDLTPLLSRFGAGIHSLQQDASAADREILSGLGIADLAPDIEDFSGTAAAIAALDLIISVDTATAHLAGAMNKPVWALLGHAADWRYLRARDDSPWYPSMRLFRQRRRGDWSELAARVGDALRREFGL